MPEHDRRTKRQPTWRELMVPELQLEIAFELLDRANAQAARMEDVHARRDAATVSMIESALKIMETNPREARGVLTGLASVLREVP